MDHQRILVVAAHPDDEVLGCGGFISKYSRESEISVLWIAEGVSTRFPADQIESRACVEAIARRTEDAIRAVKRLGVSNYKFLDHPCGRLDSIPIIELNKHVEEYIQEIQPSLIMTHSAVDCNNDHRLVHRSVMMASRPGGAVDFVEAVMSFEVLSSTEWSFGEEFRPNFFLELDKEQIAAKTSAMLEYKEEVRDAPHPRSVPGIKTQAKYRGQQIAKEFAEAFNIVRTTRL